MDETGSSTYVPTARFLVQMQAENKQKTAYLTFDDGPSKNTKKILRTLEEKKASATFFLIGKEITGERKDTIKQLIKKGNVIGVHTYCHEQNELYADTEHFLLDFQKASEAIEKVTGEKPTLHRFPWGSNNGYVSAYVDELHETLKRKGIRSFDWNVSGEDSIYPYPSQEKIFQNVKKDLTRYEKPIILLHDASAMDNTAAVLGRIIDYIREQGYVFDTLDHREEYLFPASWR
jgi:peptidoglycan/xylan/chitin deacetylase (PgdA/CDA1 family)